MSGHLANEKTQDGLRGQERRLNAIELADLEDLLRTESGRRVYYRFVFELCALEDVSFEQTAGIKDGVCAARHDAFLDGRKSIGKTLKDEALTHFPELWLRMLQERVARAAAQAEERRRIVQSTTKENE